MSMHTFTVGAEFPAAPRPALLRRTASYSVGNAMQQTCHRCGSTVSREDAFCPVCGAPQLHFDSAEQAEGAAENDASEGATRPGHVHWKTAIPACAKCAGPAGVMCALMPAGLLLWVITGSTAAVLLYRRKRPTSSITVRNGFRIGSLAGLSIAYISLLATALLRIVQRFPMHLGATIDQTYDETMRQSVTMFQSSPEAQAQLMGMLRFMLTPDGRAVSSLGGMVILSAFTVLFAAIGGALGVRLFARKRPAQG